LLKKLEKLVVIMLMRVIDYLFKQICLVLTRFLVRINWPKKKAISKLLTKVKSDGFKRSGLKRNRGEFFLSKSI